MMDRTRGMAYCGLACCACAADCPGCKKGGCERSGWCGIHVCCREKGLTGCWECAWFPCDQPMFEKLRVRTFVDLIARMGEDCMIDRLEENERQGIRYHYDGMITGDYDTMPSRDAVIELVLQGKAAKKEE